MDDALYEDDVDEIFQGLESMQPETLDSEDFLVIEVSFMKRYERFMKDSMIEA